MDVNTLKFQNEFNFIQGFFNLLLVFLFLFLAQKPILKGLFPKIHFKWYLLAILRQYFNFWSLKKETGH